MKLWDRYVFRRGNDVHELWDGLFGSRAIRLLYIAGRGFDIRAQAAMRELVISLQTPGRNLASAELLLVGFSDYELSQDLHELTAKNVEQLEAIFSPLGNAETITIGSSSDGEDEISASAALSMGLKQVLNFGNDYTDIILDVSSLPRVGFLAILTGLLDTLVPDKNLQSVDDHPLKANNVNLQVLVAEDPKLDANILPEDPSNDLVVVPGYSGIMHAESVKEWPVVWFPILGENRLSQFQKIMTLAQVPTSAEICPVLPHPSRSPRRADDLLVEYTEPLFISRKTPTTNILHVHESQPFEAYRQLLGAMQRYQHSLQMLGGCRLLVTPLSSKLITLGAGLACFEMKTALDAQYGVTIPYAEPKRYVAAVDDIVRSRPEIAALLLTGEAYA